MNCHRCQAVLQPDDRFCPECGFSAAARPDSHIPPPDPHSAVISPPAASIPPPVVSPAPTTAAPPPPVAPVMALPTAPVIAPQATPLGNPPASPPITPPTTPTVGPVGAAPNSRRRGLLAGAAILIALAGFGAAYLLVGGNDEPTAATPAPTTEAPDPTTTTVAPTTLPPTTTTTPEDQLRQARSDWEDMQDSMSTDLRPTRAALVDDRPMATTVDTATGEIVIWEYDDINKWFQADSFFLEFGNDMPYVDDIKFLDLTQDGSAEIWVSYIPGDDVMGQVFRLDGVQWSAVAYGTGMAPEGGNDSVLSGYENSCVPSCSDGNYYPYTYTWNGSRFVFQAYDNVGNPAYFEVTTECPKPYNTSYGLPLVRCDKGDQVRQLQEALAFYGFLWTGEVDGYFGPGTETAVRYYQLSKYLTVDGVVGDWFWQLIQDYNYDAFGGFGD